MEVFCLYREIYHNTPSGHGIAIRSGLSSAYKKGFVGNINLPDNSMPVTVRFTVTSIYKKLLKALDNLSK